MTISIFQSSTFSRAASEWSLRCHLQLTKSYRAILHVAYPLRCLWCGDLVQRRRLGAICSNCRLQLENRPCHWCNRCAMPLVPASDNPQRCVGCRNSQFPYTSVSAVGIYRGLMRISVVKAKKMEHAAIAQVLGLLTANALLQQDPLWRPDVVAQIPTHWRKRTARSHCSAEVMAATISTRLRRPNVLLLASNRLTEKQGTLSAADRKENVAGAFSIASDYPLQGKRVLIVDDVLTTGATAASAAKVLRDAGAAEVRVAVAARGTGTHGA